MNYRKKRSEVKRLAVEKNMKESLLDNDILKRDYKFFTCLIKEVKEVQIRQ